MQRGAKKKKRNFSQAVLLSAQPDDIWMSASHCVHRHLCILACAVLMQAMRAITPLRHGLARRIVLSFLAIYCSCLTVVVRCRLCLTMPLLVGISQWLLLNVEASHTTETSIYLVSLSECLIIVNSPSRNHAKDPPPWLHPSKEALRRTQGCIS